MNGKCRHCDSKNIEDSKFDVDCYFCNNCNNEDKKWLMKSDSNSSVGGSSLKYEPSIRIKVTKSQTEKNKLYFDIIKIKQRKE